MLGFKLNDFPSIRMLLSLDFGWIFLGVMNTSRFMMYSKHESQSWQLTDDMKRSVSFNEKMFLNWDIYKWILLWMNDVYVSSSIRLWFELHHLWIMSVPMCLTKFKEFIGSKTCKSCKIVIWLNLIFNFCHLKFGHGSLFNQGFWTFRCIPKTEKIP
jgi:hypothetical protein